MVAAGSLNIHAEQIDYLYQARWNRFEYCRGPMTGLDRAAREIVVGEVRGDDGVLVLPERRVGYDTLVIAVGSTCNDFGTQGWPSTPGSSTRPGRRICSTASWSMPASARIIACPTAPRRRARHGHRLAAPADRSGRQAALSGGGRAREARSHPALASGLPLS